MAARSTEFNNKEKLRILSALEVKLREILKKQEAHNKK